MHAILRALLKGSYDIIYLIDSTLTTFPHSPASWGVVRYEVVRLHRASRDSPFVGGVSSPLQLARRSKAAAHSLFAVSLLLHQLVRSSCALHFTSITTLFLIGLSFLGALIEARTDGKAREEVKESATCCLTD